MGSLENIYKSASQWGSAATSLLKTMIRSGKAFSPGDEKSRIIILGNGPSLRDAIDRHGDNLAAATTMAVNFAANTPDFFRLQPAYYVLADGHFFNSHSADPNVALLWESLRSIDWEMTLFVPLSQRKFLSTLPTLQTNITVKYYNLTPLEGKESIIFPLIDKGLGMPRPRNVLIPAIMLAMREGFKRIVLAGADHSWSKSLWVDDKNRVISVQPHFYADNDKERQRVENEYVGYHLHDIYNSLAIAFGSYHLIQRYATARDVSIVNATPGSFIDAFPRVELNAEL